MSNAKRILIILALTCSSEALFGNKFNKMKQKAKNFYKNKFGKDKTWHFLGTDATAYPGTHEDLRKVNDDKWNAYYTCLKQQNDNLGEQLTVTPEAVQGFEGGSLTFNCKICLSPKESEDTESIEWYWAGIDMDKLDLVEYTEHVLLKPEDKSLRMYNLQVEQTGQYVCSLGNALTAPYFLTVVNSSTNISGVHSEVAPHGPFERGKEDVPEFGLALHTEWGDWSHCSKCKVVGKKHRLGYCAVELANVGTQEPLLANTTQAIVVNFTTTSVTVSTAKPSEKGTKTPVHKLPGAEDMELLRIFGYGIPCRSHILPLTIQNLPQLRNRLDEVMTSFCKIPCPEQQIFQVKDKDGNVIEQANNSAGIYSMLQGLPPVEPAVERRLIYENRGESVAMSCPGNLNSDTPVLWQVDSKIVVPELLTRESKGRMYISVMEKFNIKKLQVSDSKVYSCWQNNELAGTIRLVVEKKMKMHFNHHIMLFGMVVILATFLYVFVKAFFGRKYAKITK